MMREGAREAAMMIGAVDGRRRRHSSAVLSTYPRRTRDVGGARTRGRGRHRPPGEHRVALRLEKERERGPQGEGPDAREMPTAEWRVANAIPILGGSILEKVWKIITRVWKINRAV